MGKGDGSRQRAGKRGLATGLSEVLEMASENIQGRYGITEGEVVAQLFLG